MELNINLNNQRNLKRSKRILRIFSLITLVLAILTGVLLAFNLMEGSVFMQWFYMFYFLLFSISLYMQSNGIHLLDLLGKSYFKLTEKGVEYKLDIFHKKINSFNWNEVEFISIKLFEIKVKVNKQLETINLEKLSDENLQLVKEIFKKRQSEIVEKDMLLTED